MSYVSQISNETPPKLDRTFWTSGEVENREYVRQFIQAYRQLSVLWDTSLRDYTNRDKRAEAYDRLLPVFRRLKRDATIEDVKKKINTLRTNYRKELRLIEYSKRLGSANIHQPRCWTFNELDFLRTSEKFNLPIPCGNVPAILTKTASPPSPPSFQCSVIQPPKQEEPVTLLETNECHTYRPPCSPFANQKRIRLLNDQTSDDFSLNICGEEESIARSWAFKLKRMQRDQRLLAEKFINEILFEGEWGTLHRGSVQINTFEPFARYDNPEIINSSMQHQEHHDDVKGIHSDFN